MIVIIQGFSLGSFGFAIGFPEVIFMANNSNDLFLKLLLKTLGVTILGIVVGVCIGSVYQFMIGVIIGILFDSLLLNIYALRNLHSTISKLLEINVPYLLLSLLMMGLTFMLR